ncbi:MAG: valine--tRNA ligase, partial [Thermoplasmata archaeon]|nr:valine--tRNA ligase [Thermoplasmata archaeon]
IYRFDFDDTSSPPYVIDNPPRYASGALHAGHAVNYSQIDFVARYKRMRGYNVFFPLCFDTNGTPIEVKVEKKHGITLEDVDRHEFIKLCREFANGFIDEMTHQFEVLGESMDPDIYYQTDAEYYRRVTQISFIKLFKKGLIYKGVFPVNWCPRCGTSIAEAEVEYQQRETRLNYIKFRDKETGEEVLIATTRPELLCTCQMVAVHPDDESKRHLMGRTLVTPVFEREVPVLADEKVDPEFGTGVVMICTIGDKDDLEWVHKYGLKIEMGIDQRGLMTDLAGPYAGMPLEEARKKIIEDMKASGLLVKQEPLQQNVGTCWRCHTPIEFLEVPQWFLKILDFKEDVLRRADEIRWFPEYMKIRLRNWVESLAWDWPISRKRYFATPLPLWECDSCGHVVLAREEDCYVDPTLDDPPVASCPECGGSLSGCTDVFDTWMDSSISPLYIAFWQRDEDLFKRLYPTSLRPQAQDIIRTWAFYTILRSHLLVDMKPWDDIMIGAYILSPDGTPMHASKGNVVDPLELLEEYGADPMRYYAATCGLGEDSPVRYKDLTRGKKLVTKFWNVERFISSIVPEGYRPEDRPPESLRTVDRWILSRYSETVEEVTRAFEEYRFDDAVKRTEMFLWHELADHYIEMSKYRRGRGDEALHYTLYTIGSGVAKLLAPIMPHVTEDAYQRFYREREGAKSIHLARWPEPVDGWQGWKDEAARGELARDIIGAVRSWKSGMGIPLNAPIPWVGVAADGGLDDVLEDIRETLKVENLEVVDAGGLSRKPVGVKPLPARIGPEFRDRAGAIMSALRNMDPAEAAAALSSGGIQVDVDGERFNLTGEYVEIEEALVYGSEEVEEIPAGGALVLVKKSS